MNSLKYKEKNCWKIFYPDPSVDTWSGFDFNEILIGIRQEYPDPVGSGPWLTLHGFAPVDDAPGDESLQDLGCGSEGRLHVVLHGVHEVSPEIYIRFPMYR